MGLTKPKNAVNPSHVLEDGGSITTGTGIKTETFNGVKQVGINCTTMRPYYINAFNDFTVYTPATDFGNATPQDVKFGKTFTSATGALVSGMYTEPISIEADHTIYEGNVATPQFIPTSYDGNVLHFISMDFEGSWLFKDGSKVVMSSAKENVFDALGYTHFFNNTFVAPVSDVTINTQNGCEESIEVTTQICEKIVLDDSSSVTLVIPTQDFVDAVNGFGLGESSGGSSSSALHAVVQGNDAQSLPFPEELEGFDLVYFQSEPFIPTTTYTVRMGFFEKNNRRGTVYCTGTNTTNGATTSVTAGNGISIITVGSPFKFKSNYIYHFYAFNFSDATELQ